MGKAFDLVGMRFGRLQVESRAANTRFGASQWNVVCNCGTEKTVRGDILVRGAAVSCGCFAKEARGVWNTTHGMTDSFEYKAWRSMRTRCESPKHPAYHRYGGAGISVCKRWLKFENFIADMGRCPFPKGSVDRLDNRRGYAPANCRWLPKAEQSKNRRNVTRINGATIPELSKKTGISASTLRQRLKAGWGGRRLLTPPTELGTRKR